MKIPILCPICQQTMLNVFVQKKEQEILTKECRKISHSLIYLILADKIIYCQLSTFSPSSQTTIWHPNKMVTIQRNNDILELPYFDPNFANYPALLNKLKTYMVFS